MVLSSSTSGQVLEKYRFDVDFILQDVPLRDRDFRYVDGAFKSPSDVLPSKQHSGKHGFKDARFTTAGIHDEAHILGRRSL